MKLSIENRKNILDLFLQGDDTKTLAAKFSVSDVTIRSVLRVFGVSAKRHKLMGEESRICSLYESGLNTVEIGKIFSVKPTSIWRILLKSGIKIRDSSECRKVLDINFSYFKEIDSLDKAYFLGLLYADGCLSSGRWQISISLQEEDGYILERFKEKIGYGGQLKFVRQDHKKASYKNQTRLSISDKRVYFDLFNLGCVPRKSQVIKFPFEHVKRKYWREFIRGYFDGDGYVCGSKRRSAGFVGNLGFLTDLQEILLQEGVFSQKYVICHNKTSTCFNLAARSKKDFFALYEYLYKDDKSNLLLKRKKKKFEDTIIDHDLGLFGSSLWSC